MQKDHVLSMVDSQRLYEHVKSTQGVKHYYAHPQNLDACAKYIENKLQSYGLNTHRHEFSCEGFKGTFANIEAYSGDATKDARPEILITSHYDTVEKAPGANDNGSAIAGMLECAEVLRNADLKNIHVRFVSFTLEELHPVFDAAIREKAFELDIFDEKGEYREYRMKKKVNEFHLEFQENLAQGMSKNEAFEEAFGEVKDALHEHEAEYIQFLADLKPEMEEEADWVGTTATVGSGRWVEDRLDVLQAAGRTILGVYNLETIGYRVEAKNTQTLPSFLFRLLPRYKTKMRQKRGDFIAIVGDKNGRTIAKHFSSNCRAREVQLPYVNATLPLSFSTIAEHAEDLLRSDHAPFMRRGIPALMITDTANFRYPFYHTEADTVDKLDFDFMKQVVQATIGAVIDIDRQYEE